MRFPTVTDLVLDELETGTETNTESESEELYNIEEIISHKMIKGVRYYRIKWEGELLLQMPTFFDVSEPFQFTSGRGRHTYSRER